MDLANEIAKLKLKRIEEILKDENPDMKPHVKIMAIRNTIANIGD